MFSLILGAALLPVAKLIYRAVHPRHVQPAYAGWGPPRPVYWCKSPTSCDGADHVVFNSYVNASNYGDERAFVDAKPASITQPGGFADVLKVSDGETVLVRLYVNNAAWDGRVRPGAGTAHGTRAQVVVPITRSHVHFVMGYLSAANARPRVVWDGTTLISNTVTSLRYVFGSGRWLVRPWKEGIAVPDALMEDGTLIGSDGLTGNFGDSFSDSGLLTFKVRVVGG